MDAAAWGSLAVTETVHPPGLRLPRHTHEPASLTYVLEGEFSERIEGRTHACGPGRVFLKSAGAEHSNVYGAEGARSLLVEVPASAFSRLAPTERTFDGARFRDVPGGGWLARRLYREFRGRDAVTPLAAEGLLLELLAAATRATAGQAAGPGPAPSWLGRARDRLHAEFRRPPSLTALADEAGVHPDYLGRAFRRHYDCTPGQFTRRIRAESAAEAIVGTDRSFSEVASLGFSDQSHLCREIKRHFGATPTELRDST